MSHNVDYASFDEKVNRREVQEWGNERAYHAGWEEGATGLISPIRWLENVVCEDYDKAHEYIKRVDKGWYDQIAVKYRECTIIKSTATLTNLQTRLANEKQKKVDYEKAHSVMAFKAEYVGCPNCGSKIKKSFLRVNSCPVCRAEMRSKTTMETLARYDANIRDLEKQIKAEERKLQEKNLKMSKIKWLVKIEYHS